MVRIVLGVLLKQKHTSATTNTAFVLSRSNMTQIINRGGSLKPRKRRTYKSAEAARLARENDAAWDALNAKWSPTTVVVKSESWSYKLSAPSGRETTRAIPSRGDGVGNATTKPTTMYTGTEMLGIGQLHKSNAVPVFREQDAVDLANMRR
jgi:hypothetical protein